MKPNTQTAMRQLIQQVRSSFPFDAPEANMCTGLCKGCSMKLLDFVDMELLDWEQRLENGEVPKFGELHRLAKISNKVYKVLDRNGLVESD